MREVIILAGGLGTRLKHLLNEKPKSLAIVANKPFLKYIIDLLLRNGVEKFYFALGYQSKLIIDFLISNYPTLNFYYNIESNLLGTGGAIRNVIDLCENDHVLIVNGDTYFELNFEDFFKFHQKNKSNFTIALKLLQNFCRYGTVTLDNSYNLVSFEEKKVVESGLINSGYSIINRSELNRFKKNVNFSFEKDYLEKCIPNKNFYGFIDNSYFIDIGIEEDFNNAQIHFMNNYLNTTK